MHEVTSGHRSPASKVKIKDGSSALKTKTLLAKLLRSLKRTCYCFGFGLRSWEELVI
ncbi:hypothetical protein AB205_0128910 [Aquarana catesbeiana]|uniref:Uncharacterized protein n=1 Tax=Aquarana catesbeiana TaxID=8400 RepID=A0A2G9QF11_AQUCT|nr:hypothetical protein AB205_0128910 [Aquarana catesbeiana]